MNPIIINTKIHKVEDSLELEVEYIEDYRNLRPYKFWLFTNTHIFKFKSREDYYICKNKKKSLLLNSLVFDKSQSRLEISRILKELGDGSEELIKLLKEYKYERYSY